MASAATATLSESSDLPPVTALERGGLIVAFLIYALFQLHASMNHGSWGQDFPAHLGWMKEAFEQPATFVTTYAEGRTNPPLYHWLAAQVVRLAGPAWDASSVSPGLIVLAILSALLHGVAMFLLYQVLRRLIDSPVLRLACLVFLLFVPFAMIHAEVIASDALATPLFFIIVYLFALLTEPQSLPRFAVLVGGLCFFMLAILATKFTAMSLVPAAGLVLLVLGRVGVLTRGRLAVAAMLLVVLPGIFAYCQFRSYQHQQTYTLGLSKDLSVVGSGFTWRCLLWPKRADLKLLKRAPCYDAISEDGKTIEITIPNRFSYLGLVHLAMFTDILNIYQYDPADNYFGVRTHENSQRMKHAVRSALVFTLGAVAAVPLLLLWGVGAVALKRDRRGALIVMIAVLAGAFFLNIVVFLPRVAAFSGGYWLPRLVAPALLSFFVLLFVGLDRLIGRRRLVAWTCLFLVVVQAVMQLSFLWPTRPA